MASPELARYLAERKAMIDDAVAARLPDPAQEPLLVNEAIRHAALSGGKRLRPIICLTVGEISGLAPHDLLDAACGIEALHAASLVLDDLPSMDNATSRRGRECTHVKYGEATALLAAMGLVALAFDLVARNAVSLARPETAPRAVQELSRAMGTDGIVRGQHTDLLLRHHSATIEQLTLAYEYKASALFLASVSIPAILSGLPEPQAASLVAYAQKVGLAFQITDDLLDAAKPMEDEGCTTFATHLGKEGARERVEHLIQEAVDELTGFPERADPLRMLAHHVKNRTV